MERITRQNVEGVFAVFVKAMNGKIAESYNDVGGYRLDYNNIYGGYNVEQIHNENGGVDQPFGSGRRSISEMFYTLHFAIRVLESINQKITQ